MKRKTIYGSIFAAILMVSLAFIQPVTADASGLTEVVDAVDHISGIAYDDNFQLYIEQLVNDPELMAIFEAVLSAEDNAQLENLLQEFNMVLESNPAYIDLMNYIDTTYGEDIAILQAFSQEATTEDMQTVINSVVSPDGTVVGDNDATADLTSSEEDSSSDLSAPEGEETTDIIPVIDPLDPTDPIYVGDMYPVYAPWLGFDPLDLDGDGMIESDVQTVYAEGYEGPIINIVGADVHVWINAEDKIGITIPGDLLSGILDLGDSFDSLVWFMIIAYVISGICAGMGLGYLIAGIILFLFGLVGPAQGAIGTALLLFYWAGIAGLIGIGLEMLTFIVVVLYILQELLGQKG